MVALEDMFKALGDGTRIRIVRMLASKGGIHVCELTEALEMQQPAVSYHLMILRRAGLLCFHREHQHTSYTLNREAMACGPLAFLEQILSLKDNRGEHTLAEAGESTRSSAQCQVRW